MSLALYRKYRSNSFDQIVGQRHITNILKEAINQSKYSHAYLFTGPRGVGKTSVARIMAYAINGLAYNNLSQHIDIIEIDAASNNGVDNIRDLREKVMVAPAIAPKKVYIIDEVHMLSTSAFNALLKTLEEPPAHVVFILATTDVHKVPATIISRTQRFAFKSIPKQEIIAHLKTISINEHINITNEALELIADYGEGSLRDCISLLDQMSNLSDKSKPIDAGLIETSLGLAPKKVISDLISSIETRNYKLMTKTIIDTVDQGIDVVTMTRQLMNELLNQSGTHPRYLEIIDGLIGVNSSQYPNLKLISVLGTAITGPDSDNRANNKTSALKVSNTIDQIYSLASPETSLVTNQSISNYIDKNQLLKLSMNKHIAFHSLIKKCHFEIHQGIVTVYANNNFNKKKLDDTKYRQLLIKLLKQAKIDCSDIITIAASEPHSKSVISEISDIMGGGELVELTTDSI